MTGLSINSKIYDILNADTTFKGMCNSYYPVIAEENVAFPFVLYRRDNVQPIDCKQCVVGDRVTFSFAIVSDKYSQTIQIAERLRQLFEKRRGGYFRECNFIGCNEDYNENAYTQQLDFSAVVG